MERETTSKGWCNRCQRYQTLSTRKTIRRAPSVLMLNTAIREVEQSQLWCTPGWVPDEIGVIVDQGQFFCYEGDDLKHHVQRGFHNIQVYSLVGLAVNVTGTQGQNPHLVAIIDGKPPIPVLHRERGCVGTFLTWDSSLPFAASSP